MENQIVADHSLETDFYFSTAAGVSSPSVSRRSLAMWLQMLQWHCPCSERAVAKHRPFSALQSFLCLLGTLIHEQQGSWRLAQRLDERLPAIWTVRKGKFPSDWKQKLSTSISAILFLLENKKSHWERLSQFSAKIFKFWVIKSTFSIKKRNLFSPNTTPPGILTAILPAHCFHTKRSLNWEWCTEYRYTIMLCNNQCLKSDSSRVFCSAPTPFHGSVTPQFSG